MLLSFVIPTRNQGRFIARCIDSCLEQRVADAEILVIDGASTDETVELVRGYGDRVRLVSEPDRGQSDAVNKGIALARGELVAWINSDDYYASPTALHPLVEAFRADLDLEIAYGDGVRVNAEGKRIGTYPAQPIRGVEDIITIPASFVAQPAVMFRKRLFDTVGGVDISLRYTMDYDLWLRMFPAARGTRYIQTDVACMRYHADAKSVDAMGRQILEAYQVKRLAARRHRLGVRARGRLYAGMASLAAYWAVTWLGLRRDA